MPDVSKVKSGDALVFNVDQKVVELEILGKDPIMPEIYSFDLQSEEGVINIIVNSKGEDILGEFPLGDVYKVVKKAKKVKDVNYELAEFEKERQRATGNQ